MLRSCGPSRPLTGSPFSSRRQGPSFLESWERPNRFFTCSLGQTASCPSTCALPLVPEVSGRDDAPCAQPQGTKDALYRNVLCQPTSFNSIRNPAFFSFFSFLFLKKKIKRKHYGEKGEKRIGEKGEQATKNPQQTQAHFGE